MKYYTCLENDASTGIAGRSSQRTGYTGEDGYEILPRRRVPATGALAHAARARQATWGLEPAGLGARDVLRLEAGMPLYGLTSSTEDVSPLAGGQSWAVKTAKPDYLGKAALVAQLADDGFDRIAGVVLAGRVPARGGYPVYLGAERVGEVRSASLAPACGNRNVATVLVSKQASAPGTLLEIEIRGARHEVNGRAVTLL